METTCYLVPAALCGTNGKAAMEYRIVMRRRDMRTRFCKDHEKDIIEPEQLQAVIKQMRNNVRVKGDRVILKDGRAAYTFSTRIRIIRKERRYEEN